MLLAFDVGNTHTVAGIFDVASGELKQQFRIATDKQMTADELGMLLVNLFQYNQLNTADVESLIISSVVPQIMYSMQHMAIKYFNCEPMVIGPGVKTGMNIKYDNPKEVGADRIVNGVAAFKKYGGPVIVVGFGTATTFCVINERCEYIGGAIMPGIKVSADALTDRAAKLSRVELETTDKIICKNTNQSIQSGIFYGTIGAVDYIVKQILEELSVASSVPVVATGGMSSMIGEASQMISHVDRYLTLEGLYQIYMLNREG